jgi:hypothetical protein
MATLDNPLRPSPNEGSRRDAQGRLRHRGGGITLRLSAIAVARLTARLGLISIVDTGSPERTRYTRRWAGAATSSSADLVRASIDPRPFEVDGPAGPAIGNGGSSPRHDAPSAWLP